MAVNLAGFFNAFRVLTRPSLFVPHHTVATFGDLPIPLDAALVQNGREKVEIRAVVLDKDDCFAAPDALVIHKPYEDKFAALRAAYPGLRLLIVSNSAGSASRDPDGRLAARLETATGGVPVLRHARPKPACDDEIMAYFRARPETGVERPSQIVVVGDRLGTDVALAHRMGAWAVWVRDGVVEDKSLFTRIERQLGPFLEGRGVRPPEPAR